MVCIRLGNSTFYTLALSQSSFSYSLVFHFNGERLDNGWGVLFVCTLYVQRVYEILRSLNFFGSALKTTFE